MSLQQTHRMTGLKQIRRRDCLLNFAATTGGTRTARAVMNYRIQRDRERRHHEALPQFELGHSAFLVGSAFLRGFFLHQGRNLLFVHESEAEMAIKPDGELLSIREQIIEDPITGLTFQFAVVPGTSVPFRLRIYGAVPQGNRELAFSSDGECAAAGTATAGTCRASWLQAAD